MGDIRNHKELRVWQDAMDAAMTIFHLTKLFPIEERFSMVDQMRRSSRSVAANIAEAWRKRRYRAAFISKLNDAESEASETQTWIEFALRCQYMNEQQSRELDAAYERIIGQLVVMMRDADKWTL